MTLFKLIIIAKFESSGTGNRMGLYFDNRTGTSSYLKVQPDRTDSNRCFPDYCVCFLWNFRVPHFFPDLWNVNRVSVAIRDWSKWSAHIRPSIKENKRCPGAGGGEREHQYAPVVSRMHHIVIAGAGIWSSWRWNWNMDMRMMVVTCGDKRGDNRGGNGGDDGGDDNGDDGGDGKQKLNL